MTQITVAREGGFAPGDVIEINYGRPKAWWKEISIGPWTLTLEIATQHYHKVTSQQGATLTTKKLPWWHKVYWF